MPTSRTWEERPIGNRVFEVLPGVFRIPLPTRFAVGDVNAWLIAGRHPVLVDCGLKGPETEQVLREALEAAGLRLEDIRSLVLTHGHVDHAGLARTVREASGCAVFLHPAGHARLTDPVSRQEADREALTQFFRRCGVSEQTLAVFRPFSSMPLRLLDPCPDLLAAREGVVVEPDPGRVLRCIETPGHSKDHTSWWLKDQGVVFTGDHLLPHITANPTLEASGIHDEHPVLDAYQDALKRIAGLGVRVACPGHGPPFREVAERCREVLDHQDARVDQVLQVVRRNGSMTRKDLAQALFGPLRGVDVYLALSEVEAAVGWLASRGRVRLVSDGPVDRVVSAGEES